MVFKGKKQGRAICGQEGDTLLSEKGRKTARKGWATLVRWGETPAIHVRCKDACNYSDLLNIFIVSYVITHSQYLQGRREAR